VNGGKRERRHHRSEIRATDADVDDIRDRLAGRALQGAGANTVGKTPHGFQDRVYIRHHVLAVDHDRRIGAVAQGCMKDGAAFGEVDGLSGEHAFPLGGNTGLAGELLEKSHDRLVHGRLGIIHQQVAEGNAVVRETLGIGRKRGAQIGGFRGGGGILQVFDDSLHGKSS
jgi:hypothetical protein